jgi:DNA-binding response OmpR family regulator
VIEDEPLTALEIEDTLTEEGYRAIGPSTTVASALEAINRGGVDAAIIDGGLLGTSAARVREKLDQAGVPYVFISDQLLSTEDISPNMRLIRRPIRNAQLIELLAELLGPQESRSP